MTFKSNLNTNDALVGNAQKCYELRL